MIHHPVSLSPTLLSPHPPAPPPLFPLSCLDDSGSSNLQSVIKLILLIFILSWAYLEWNLNRMIGPSIEKVLYSPPPLLPPLSPPFVTSPSRTLTSSPLEDISIVSISTLNISRNTSLPTHFMDALKLLPRHK
jgi:hypothetical protein